MAQSVTQPMRLAAVALTWLIAVQHAVLAMTVNRILAGQPETYNAAWTDQTHRLTKRMELETCIGHFDVHKNTIIRTGESQAIGGKYLQGLELDTMEECERLCCETDSCDVYIFEKKNLGYCYLFECGPPENFHCKFTRHANYTSAVLTPQVRHASEATTPRPSVPHIGTTNISQQEWELSNLKLKPDVKSVSVAAAAAAATGVTAVATGAATPDVVAAEQKAAGGSGSGSGNTSMHCGRFQFMCHSGECIAVYNACDGIPQCEDGSDEGPECNSMPSAVSSPFIGGTIKMNTNGIGKPSIPNQYQNSPTTLQQAQDEPQSNLPQHLPPQQLPAVQQQSGIINAQPQAVVPPIAQVSNNREDATAWANRKIITEQQQQQQQADMSNTAELNSHIFNHKGGLQLAGAPSGGNSNAAAYASANLNTNLNPMYAVSLQRSGIYMPTPQQLGLPAQQAQPQMMPQADVLPVNLQHWPAQQQSQQQQQQLPNQNAVVLQQYAQGPGPAYIINTADGSAQQMPVPAPPSLIGAGQQHTPVAAAEPATPAKLAPRQPAEDDDDDEFEDYDVKSTEPPKKKLRKHKKQKNKSKSAAVQQTKDPIELSLEQQKHQNTAAVAVPVPAPVPHETAAVNAASPVHEQYKMIHENLALEFRDHDGHSERPGGAVLSLALGLLVTAALAILIGCRMRTVGRRARRLGGKPYSQEADFLVNGMYL